ncbi:excalibur calcium-binding domain-containing protein [Actinomycetospora atypica]|uniref:Excalibur calcium-binding domain-containing protein n=1 Tax=Actinomycetospora atypica TaxID=1290095 RepID=A0ABV9YQX8_9PSEU
MKRIASTMTVSAILVLAPVGVAGIASAAPYYSSCAAAFAAGQSDIRIGEPGYRKGLDRDGDGVACEREEGSGSSSNSGSGSGSGSGSNNSSAGESTSSDSSQISSDEGSQDSEDSDDSTGDQVEVVPTGGAETGDGSTADYTSWWFGGGLVAGLAGLLTARRHRAGTVSAGG